MNPKGGKEEAPFDLENQFVLRLPNEQAEAVRRIVHSGNMNLRDRFTIELHPDGRHGVVRVDSVSLPARLVELPCIIESLKTIDKKNFYKTANLCQMLVCSAGDEEVSRPDAEAEEAGAKRREREKRFTWSHGITPPLKNVRKRRFRKSARKKYIECPDVEKEIKRLLRTDAEAVSVRWEVILDEDAREGGLPPLLLDPAGGSVAGGAHRGGGADHDELREIFNELSSSEDDEDDDHLLLHHVASSSSSASAAAAAAASSSSSAAAAKSSSAVTASSSSAARASASKGGAAGGGRGGGATRSRSGRVRSRGEEVDYDEEEEDEVDDDDEEEDDEEEVDDEEDHVNVMDGGRRRADSGGAGGNEQTKIVSDIRAQVETLSQRLRETRDRRRRQDDLVNKVGNVALKNRLQANLDDVMRQEEKEEQQLEVLRARLEAELTRTETPP